MSFRLREEHLDVLISFMENHSNFATGRLSVKNGRHQFKELWSELSSSLNSLGFGFRSVEKWQKTWSDYKCNLKKKASEISRHRSMTGGGPPSNKTLSPMEERVLDLLGESFYQGLGSAEVGLTLPQEPTLISTTTPTTTDKDCNIENAENVTLNNHKRKCSEKLDHDYTAKNVRKKRKIDNMNNVYKETLVELREIKEEMKGGLQKINITLEKGFSELNSNLNTVILNFCQPPFL